MSNPPLSHSGIELSNNVSQHSPAPSPAAIASPSAFKPTWRFYAIFASLCTISLAAALDATTISVALPVIEPSQPFYRTPLTSLAHHALPPRQRHKSLLDGNLLPPRQHRLPTHLGLPLSCFRPQKLPPGHPRFFHRRCSRRGARAEFHRVVGGAHDPGLGWWRHHRSY